MGCQVDVACKADVRLEGIIKGRVWMFRLPVQCMRQTVLKR